MERDSDFLSSQRALVHLKEILLMCVELTPGFDGTEGRFNFDLGTCSKWGNHKRGLAEFGYWQKVGRSGLHYCVGRK